MNEKAAAIMRKAVDPFLPIDSSSPPIYGAYPNESHFFPIIVIIIVIEMDKTLRQVAVLLQRKKPS